MSHVNSRRSEVGIVASAISAARAVLSKAKTNDEHDHESNESENTFADGKPTLQQSKQIPKQSVSMSDPNTHYSIHDTMMDFCDFTDLFQLSQLSKAWYDVASIKQNPYQYGCILYYKMCDLDMLRLKENDLSSNIFYLKYGQTEWFKHLKFYNQNFLLKSCNFNKRVFWKEIVPIIGKKLWYINARMIIAKYHQIHPFHQCYSPYREGYIFPCQINDKEEHDKAYSKLVLPDSISELKKRIDAGVWDSPNWAIIHAIKVLKRIENKIDEMVKYRDELASHEDDLILVSTFGQSIGSWISDAISGVTGGKIKYSFKQTTLQTKFAYSVSFVFDFINFFNVLNVVAVGEEELKLLNYKSNEKYDYLVNESTLKLILKLFGNKLDKFDDCKNYKIEETARSASWFEFFYALLQQSCIHLSHQVPPIMNTSSMMNLISIFDNVTIDLPVHMGDYDKNVEILFYQHGIKKVLLDNSYNLHNTVNIWRCGLILSMYIFSNQRFSLNDYNVKFMENTVCRSVNEFDIVSLKSFIENKYYHKMMIVLEKLMNLKYFGKNCCEFEHPKCGQYSKQFFMSQTACNYNWQQEHEIATATRLEFVRSFSKLEFLSKVSGCFSYHHLLNALFRVRC